MKVEATKSFLKQLKKLQNSDLNREVKQVIEEITGAEGLSNITNIKKLTGFSGYYRIRIGSYRIGIYFDQNIVWLAAIADRKDIYRLFP